MDSRVLVESAQTAARMEIVDSGWPPDKPPDGLGSWLQMVKGSGRGGRPIPEEVVDDEFVSSRLSLEFPDGEDGVPVVTIGEEVLEAMNRLWKKCMIVKVLGRNISLPILHKRLIELWKPSGTMHVMDLPRQFFMIRFEKEDEYLAALVGGPWRVFGSHLVVRAWSPEFDPLKDEINTTPVWIRLMNIPVNFYHKSILLGIARGLGKPIKVDGATLQFERARFARICVEVDLKKPLKGMVLINGEKYYVAYEGLTNICSLCGLYGHLIHNCPKHVQEREATMDKTKLTVNVTRAGGSHGGDGFTVVQNQSRKSRFQQGRVGPMAGNVKGQGSRNSRGFKSKKDADTVPISNVFGRLEDTLGGSEIEGEESMIDANKENIDSNIEQTGKSVTQGRPVEFRAGLSEGRNGDRTKGDEKKAGERKFSGKSGFRARQGHVKSSGGLVFGSTGAKMGLSSTGKRLRVEGQNAGRPGGSFSSGNVELMMDMNPLAMQLVETESVQVVTGEAQPRKECDMQSEPSSRETEMRAA